MNKKNPQSPDELNEGSLDEYGVWVKAGPEDQVVESGESISDLLDDSIEEVDNRSNIKQEPSSFEDDMILQEPQSGSQPGAGISRKGQEVNTMNEKDKTNNASSTNESGYDSEIILDEADELTLSSADDDLGGLSDLLLNIDDENEEDDTIYLEDDDLSFDLDQENEDLLLDQESDSQSGDDFGEDIVIPGLDGDLDIENDETPDGLDLLNDSLDALDEDEFPAEQSNSQFEIHGVEEVGLDEFLDAQLDFEDNQDILTHDEESPEMMEERLTDTELSLDIDLGPEISLDETMADLPAMDEKRSISTAKDDDFSDLEIEIEEPRKAPNDSKHFDDVAAFTDEIIGVKVHPELGSGSSQVLVGIEEELHAIRSELTDLRNELKKLREKDMPSQRVTSGQKNVTLEDDIDQFEETLADTNEQAQTVGKGFFDDDEDETIALTGDELDNILNTADFTEEAGEPSSLDLEEDVAVGGEQLSSSAVPVSHSDFTFSDSTDVETSDSHKSRDESQEAFESDDFSDFPPIEEISLEEIQEPSIQDDPFNSTANSTELETLEADEEHSVQTNAEVAQLAQLDIEKELAGIEDLNDDEEDFELYTGGELDSLEIEIPESFNDDVAIAEQDDELPSDVDDLEDFDLPNLDEEAEETKAEETIVSKDISHSLKQEIKAVLAYMDQLLESLPEEKIEEFAKSEHFEVYKKLFDELGL